jgi:GNAT superfamily N-acetyltransferase
MAEPSHTNVAHAVTVVDADLARADHAQAVIELVDAYARDPMGNGQPLAADVREAIVPGLRAHPTTLVFLAYHGEKPIGVAVCFRGFSTFAARPLVNVHDLAVLPAYRGQGVGQRLLQAVEAKARQLGCCKLTLEVQENNARARRTYAAAGFAQSEHQAAAGGALFYSKPLRLD